MFSAVLAFVFILAPYAGWGGGNLLIMHVSRDHQLFPIYWGNALLLSLISSICLIALAVTLCASIFPDLPCVAVMLIALSELFFMRIAEISGQAFQAFENMSMTAKIQLFPGLFRLVAVICFIKVGNGASLDKWAAWYFGSSIASGVLSLIIVTSLLGWPKPCLMHLKKQIIPGFYFSLGISAKSVYADIDKTMLARLSTADATGIYATAYRFISFAFAPILSLLTATNARFYRSGEAGLKNSFGFALRLMPFSTGYGILAALLLLGLAPVIPIVLGQEYARSTDALRWLAIVPCIQGFHYLFADALTGAGLQKARSLAQVFIALFNVLLNSWLIPLYSWKGAAWATIVSEGLLGCLLLCLLKLATRESTEVQCAD